MNTLSGANGGARPFQRSMRIPMRAIRMLLVSALALGTVTAYAGEQDVQRLTQLLGSRRPSRPTFPS